MKATHVVFSILILGPSILYTVSPDVFKSAVKCAVWPLALFLEKTGLIWRILSHEYEGHTYVRFFMPPYGIARGRAFVPAKNDIFISSMVQSGTHFVQQIIMQLLTNGTLEFNDVAEVAHALEVADGSGQPLDKTLYHERKVIQSHLYADHVQYSPDRAKYVVIIRDPIERLASTCAFVESVCGALAPSCTSYLDFDPLMPDGWPGWVAGWYARRNESNVKIVLFDHLRHNHVSMIHELAEFLEIPFDEMAVEMIRYRSSLEFMRAHEERFRAFGIPYTFVRLNSVGRDVYTKDEQKFIYQSYVENLRSRGSDFDMNLFKQYRDLVQKD